MMIAAKPRGNDTKYDAPKRWTVSECRRMVEVGLLTERYELIEGEIISKMGQNPPHRMFLILISEWLVGVFGYRRVQCQLPIVLTGNDRELSEPEPDIAITKSDTTFYTTENPVAEEVLLVVEIADSSLSDDLYTKDHLYARNGIPEYWVVDVVGRRVVVHRRPATDGYLLIETRLETDEIAPLIHPDARIKISDLLPPSPSVDQA